MGGEQNWVLESKSVKKKHWLVVVELGNMLEKVLIDFGKLFQRIGAIWLIFFRLLREDVRGRIE